MWLGTLSTVVAVATGMFTLRDQIFPNDAGTASASVTAFETSVGDICAGLNAADRARGVFARSLARRLARAKDVVDERNAMLDSWNAVLNNSEYWLGQFNGLDVPPSLLARDRVTSTSWGRIVTHIRNFTEQLDATSDARSLEVAIKPLPSMQAADEADALTRSSGLKALGGGQCRLNPAVLVSTVTLPQRRLAVRLESVTAAKAAVSARATTRRRGPSTGRSPGAAVGAGSGQTASPSVAPSRTSTVAQQPLGPSVAAGTGASSAGHGPGPGAGQGNGAGPGAGQGDGARQGAGSGVATGGSSTASQTGTSGP